MVLSSIPCDLDLERVRVRTEVQRDGWSGGVAVYIPGYLMCLTFDAESLQEQPPQSEKAAL